MGISVGDLMILEGIFRDPALRAREQINVLSLAYADVIVSDAAYDRFFPGVDWRSVLRGRANREKLLAIHGGNPQLISVVPTLDSFFRLYGNVKVDVIDFTKYEGSEIIHDMGEPIPSQLAGKYDVVIDGGTTEHVFDIATALFNCAKLVREGGFIFHDVPMNMLNHGFYNLNPTLLHDFYEDNGFKTTRCTAMGCGITDNPQLVDLPSVDRFNVGGAEACMLYVARKMEERDQLVKPIQRKYRDVEAWR